MKFKITRSEFEMLSSAFSDKKDKVWEINLEPADQTATQAIYEQSVKQKAWHDGYHYGMKEGYYKAKNPEPYRCGCGCFGTKCALIHCGDHCKYL